jgi:hypothetical protein
VLCEERRTTIFDFHKNIREIRSKKDSPMLYGEAWLVALDRRVSVERFVLGGLMQKSDDSTRTAGCCRRRP